MISCPMPAPVLTPFMDIQVKRLLKRYFLTFTREDTCMEYFLRDVKTCDLVSLNLVLSHDRFSKGIYISKFYPQLFCQFQPRFLSAACFFLMVHHSAGVFGLADHCRISLETEEKVFADFYSRLIDFHFTISRHRPANRVCLNGFYPCLPIARKIMNDI